MFPQNNSAITRRLLVAEEYNKWKETGYLCSLKLLNGVQFKTIGADTQAIVQELKNLRPQLYSAAEYCESSYLYSDQKQM